MPLEAPREGMIGLLDSGTTRTRLRVWHAGRLAWQAEREVGSADVARAGNNAALHAAVSELLTAARAQGPLTAVVASGMISSNVGLLEVAQLQAPVRYDELAVSLVRHEFAQLGEVHFVRGVRTLPPALSLESLADADVMRGEETEVVGLRSLLGIRGPASFLHYGSHHKLIHTDDHGIQGSRTTLNGELLASVSSHTILRGSLPPLAEVRAVDEAWWRQGLEASVRHGFGRACFMVRLAEQLLRASAQECASFLLGAVASLDLPLLGRERLILYGRPTMTLPMQRYLQEQGLAVEVADEDVTQQAAVVGALRLYRQHAGMEQ